MTRPPAILERSNEVAFAADAGQIGVERQAGDEWRVGRRTGHDRSATGHIRSHRNADANQALEPTDQFVRDEAHCWRLPADDELPHEDILIPAQPRRVFHALVSQPEVISVFGTGGYRRK